MNYTFDTNILLYIFRESKLKYKLAEALDLANANNTLIISAVSIGEINALAMKNQWGEKKKSALKDFLTGFIVVPVDETEIVNIYAQIDALSQGKLSQNHSKPPLATWAKTTFRLQRLPFLPTLNYSQPTKTFLILMRLL